MWDSLDLAGCLIHGKLQLLFFFQLMNNCLRKVDPAPDVKREEGYDPLLTC